MSEATSRGKDNQGSPQGVRYFKLTSGFSDDTEKGDIPKASCKFIFWRSGAMRESTVTDKVYDPPRMFAAGTSGKHGYCYYFPGLGEWVVIQMEC